MIEGEKNWNDELSNMIGPKSASATPEIKCNQVQLEHQELHNSREIKLFKKTGNKPRQAKVKYRKRRKRSMRQRKTAKEGEKGRKSLAVLLNV